MESGGGEAADTEEDKEEEQQPEAGGKTKACTRRTRRTPNRLRYEKLGDPSDRYHPGGWKY